MYSDASNHAPEQMKVGTPEWSIYHLKAIGIPRLIDDLEKLECRGYKEDVCKAVISALQKSIEATNELDGTFWKPCVASDLESFKQIYIEWNSRGEGSSIADRVIRKQKIEEMRSVRYRMARSIRNRRKKGDLLHTEDDGILAKRTYDGLAALAEEYPAYFLSLGKAAKSFMKKQKRPG